MKKNIKVIEVTIKKNKRKKNFIIIDENKK